MSEAPAARGHGAGDIRRDLGAARAEGLGVGGIAVTIFARLDDWRRGRR